MQEETSKNESLNQKETILFRKEIILPENQNIQSKERPYFPTPKIFLEKTGNSITGKPELERIVDENGKIIAMIDLEYIKDRYGVKNPIMKQKIAESWLLENLKESLIPMNKK